MADPEPKAQGFFKSVGGIVTSVVTAVLTAVLIAHFVPSPSPKPDPPVNNVVVPPTPPPQVELDGTVADSVTQKLVSNANVTLTIGPNSISQKTDIGGRYAVLLPATDPREEMGQIDIAADGYKPYSNTHLLHTGDDNFAGIPIDSLASLAPPPPVATVPNVHPGHPLPLPLPVLVHRNTMILNKPPSNYIKRQPVGLSKK
jgi:hypothetical protein